MAAIASVDAAAYTIPTDAPEGDGTLLWDATTLVVAQVHADGRTGLGWTYGPTACATIINDTLAGLLLGADPVDVPRCFETLVTRTRNDTRAGVVGYAISALDVALWDLKARLLGVPLHRLLGAARPAVPVYGSGGFVTYDAERLDRQLRHWTDDQGIPRVKIKIGERSGADERRDLTRIRQARRIVGDGVELYVDANGGYHRKQAVRLAAALHESDVRWYEEPVSSDDLAGLREVRDATPIEVTAGEYGSDLFYFRRMCAAGAVDCLQVDLSRCGGITEWLRVAAVAAAHGLDVSGHGAPHLHLHAAAAAPNLRHLEWFHDHVRIETALFDGTLDPAGGLLTPRDDSPGHGYTLRATDARRYRTG